MWCSTCQRDVLSAIPPGGSALVRCEQCGTTLGYEPSRIGTPGEVIAGEQRLAPPPLPDDDWQLEADLRWAHRLVDRLRGHSDREATRIDLPSGIAHGHLALPRIEPAQARIGRSQPRPDAAAWLLLSLGLATFACGAVLLGWSHAAGRQDLWPIGMPLTLAGLAALIVGLVLLQLEGLWHTSKQTEQSLSAIDAELTRVRQATAVLSTAHSTPPPPLLLADLKGQFDLLAQQFSRGP